MTYPIAFMINDLVVTSPDTWIWSPTVLGTSHDVYEVRSPVWTLTFTKRAVNCRVDWQAYDNVKLSSLTVPGHDDPRAVRRYTEVTCMSVDVTYSEGVPTGITAIFQVNTEVY